MCLLRDFSSIGYFIIFFNSRWNSIFLCLIFFGYEKMMVFINIKGIKIIKRKLVYR